MLRSVIWEDVTSEAVRWEGVVWEIVMCPGEMIRRRDT